VFEGKSVKKLAIHTSNADSKDYLVLGTFQMVKGEGNTEKGYPISEELLGMGYQYDIDVYMLPKDGQWKSYTANFDPS